MSRIGRLPVALPAGVEVKVDGNNVVTVKGPKGELQEQISKLLKVEVSDGTLTVTRDSDDKTHRSQHGLARTLINNMVVGVTNGFEKTAYMTIEEVKAHAQKFSQTYRKGAGIWKDNFEAMAKKTCLKRLLTKWAPKSLEMNMLQTFDQSVVKGDIHHLDEAEPQYIDRNVEHADSDDNAYTDVEDVTTESDSAPKDASPVNNTDDNKAKDELEF